MAQTIAFNDPEFVITTDLDHTDDLANWLTANVPAEELAAYQEVHGLREAAESAAVSAGILTVTTDSETHVTVKTFANIHAFLATVEARAYFEHPKNLDYRNKATMYYTGNTPETLFVPEY